MRKALCVGIDYYRYANCLPGCVKDAAAIEQALKQNYDKTPNFEIKAMHALDNNSAITKEDLTQEVKALFSEPLETALFYYSGHGSVDDEKGYLFTSEGRSMSDGLSMETLMNIIKDSKATNKIIILDSCFSGSLGKFNIMPGWDLLPENTTILAASRSDEPSVLGRGGSVFTMLLFEALYGGAANILGEITPASIYAFIDRSLGYRDQRPVFKANLENFICIRKHTPPIKLEDLKQITDIFYQAHHEFDLDPSYEEDKRDVADKTHNKEHEAVFAILRKLHSLNLVVPVGEEYMYWAAVNSKACKLTPLGRHYWNLITDKRI